MLISEKIAFVKKCRENALKLCEELRTDLVEASYHCGCCAECAKYRGRWFSVSGKDKRFPKMPVNYGCTCVGLTFSPVIWGVSRPIHYGRDADIIEISNRPFVDDRTENEIESYEIRKAQRENDLFWEQYNERWRAINRYDHQQYDLLTQFFPEQAPKSFSGYMSMKHGNTKNYQKLILIAGKQGISLEYPAELLEEIEFLTPIRKKYIKTVTETNIRMEKLQEKLRLQNNKK